MKKYGLAKALNLIISITAFSVLIVLAFFLNVDWNDNFLLRFALSIITMLLFFVGLWVVITLLWIILEPIFKRKEMRERQNQIEQGNLLFCEPMGELIFRDGWCKTEGISLFNEGYRITVKFQANFKDEQLTDEQKKAYSGFWDMYEHCCEQLENMLEEKNYADIFEPDEIVFEKNGDCKMLASDATCDDSDFEFVVTFNPLEVNLK